MTCTRKPSLITGNFPKRQEVAVNKSELVDQVAGSTGLEKRQAESAVTAMIDAVIAEAKSGNRVSIFGFGTFTPTSRAARVGRNPQTGAPVKIAASKGVRFAPAQADIIAKRHPPIILEYMHSPVVWSFLAKCHGRNGTMPNGNRDRK